MNWHVAINASGNPALSQPSLQRNHAASTFTGAAISMGGPSAAAHVLFLAPHAGGTVGVAKRQSDEVAQASLLSLLAVSTFSLQALSMALFRVEEKRNEQYANEQRAESHKVAAQRRSAPHTEVALQQDTVPSQGHKTPGPSQPSRADKS